MGDSILFSDYIPPRPVAEMPSILVFLLPTTYKLARNYLADVAAEDVEAVVVEVLVAEEVASVDAPVVAAVPTE